MSTASVIVVLSQCAACKFVFQPPPDVPEIDGCPWCELMRLRRSKDTHRDPVWSTSERVFDELVKVAPMPLTATELAHRVGKTPDALRQVCRKMEARGLLRRGTAPRNTIAWSLAE